MSERGQEELMELANKYNAAVNEIKELTDKIKVRHGHDVVGSAFSLHAAFHARIWGATSGNADKTIQTGSDTCGHVWSRVISLSLPPFPVYWPSVLVYRPI